MRLHPARIVGLLLLCLLPLAACSDEKGETTTEAPPAHPAFSGEDAHRLLVEQVAFGPRIPGQPGHARQLEWMTRYLGERADTVIAQPFEWKTTGGETLSLTNLFVRFRPELKDRILS